MNILKRFFKDESGLETIEWTIMAALIVLGIVVAVVSLQGKITEVFNALSSEMTNAQAGG